MSWFDDPAEYFGPAQPNWSLGDLVVAPHGVLCLGEGPDPSTVSPGLSERVRRTLWREQAPFLAVTADAGWDLGMVVLDDCALDRDFNREVDRRTRDHLRSGISGADAAERAERGAREVPDLDPMLTIAQVRPYSDYEVARHDALRRGVPFGYFPVLGTAGVDSGLVDLSLTTTVQRATLIGRAAALSETARNALRYKLAEFTALRARITDAAIESAVGRRITKADAYREAAGKKETLVVRLELDDGAEVIVLRGN